MKDSNFCANKITGANAGGHVASQLGCSGPRASLSSAVSCDMKLHSVLLGWSDPDQALRVAAGIPRKHASDGLWPGGHYCPGCGAFPVMYQTWQPQAGRELESEDMVKTK